MVDMPRINLTWAGLLGCLLTLSGCSSCQKTGVKGGGSNGSNGSNGGNGGCGLRTCESANANCGPIGDGCGNTIDCGTCSETEFCGGGGPSKCGGHSCDPQTCETLGVNCGVVADGCGSLLHCGSCDTDAGIFCGGGGANICGTGEFADGGSATCVQRTCAQAHANCGPVADGCGGLISCGGCPLHETCGGAGSPSVCGAPVFVDGGAVCHGLCLKQVTCDGGAANPTLTTTVTGTVYAPNGVDPLYNALVYVPNAPVQPFTPGVACLTCENQVTGEPLVSTTTGPDGTFTLENVPVDANVPLVIQLGRWRRQVTLPTVAACTNTPVTADLTRLPKNKTEGDIPLTAMVTGNVDALECVLRKIGVDDTEFTNPGNSGRIQLFTAHGDGGGAQIDATTPDSTALMDNPTMLANYDVVLLACEGYQNDKSTAELGDILNYANAGGRVFATHFSYTWLYSASTWQTAANWHVNEGMGNQITGILDTSFPKGLAFSQWLDVVHASTATGSGQIDINQWRWDVDSVLAPTQRWIYTNGNNTNSIQHMTFNTPFGATDANLCGRVLYSDFHVTDANTKGKIFPAECTAGALTAQEHVLEFMLFDLTSCVTSDTNPSCAPISCEQAHATCGPIGDGCGNTTNCGSCPTGQTCGGAGVPSQCGTPSCNPRSCAQQNIQCGNAGDGCGNTIDCGSCPQGQTCGGGGVPNVCGKPPCTPTTCAAQHANCGTIADGCGATLNCGACSNGDICGLTSPNVCGGFR
jgi:hypothetical protein